MAVRITRKDKSAGELRQEAARVPGWESGATDVGDCPGSGWG